MKFMGVALMGVGAVILVVARTAFHETTATLAFGLGGVILGLSAVIDRLTEIRDGLRSPNQASAESALPETKPQPKPDPEITWRSRGTR